MRGLRRVCPAKTAAVETAISRPHWSERLIAASTRPGKGRAETKIKGRSAQMLAPLGTTVGSLGLPVSTVPSEKLVSLSAIT